MFRSSSSVRESHVCSSWSRCLSSKLPVFIISVRIGPEEWITICINKLCESDRHELKKPKTLIASRVPQVSARITSAYYEAQLEGSYEEGGGERPEYCFSLKPLLLELSERRPGEEIVCSPSPATVMQSLSLQVCCRRNGKFMSWLPALA